MQKIKIALSGTGKMGRTIEALAQEKGLLITTLEEADVCLDFSHPESVLKNIKKACAFQKNIVVGTTGWYDHIPEVERLVKEADIGLIYSPNFSIGVQIFLRLAAHAARLFDPFADFDIGGQEIHHSQKADMPSGTAKALGDALIKNSTRKHSVVFGSSPKDPHSEIHISSLRIGNVPGTHEALFDSPSETISLSCTSRNRTSFASGALLAAEWIHQKKGFYTFDTVINEKLNS